MRLSRKEGIDAVIAKHKLDAIVTLTSGPAWLIDTINGDHDTGGCTTPQQSQVIRISRFRRASIAPYRWGSRSSVPPGARGRYSSWHMRGSRWSRLTGNRISLRTTVEGSNHPAMSDNKTKPLRQTQCARNSGKVPRNTV